MDFAVFVDKKMGINDFAWELNEIFDKKLRSIFILST